MHHEENMNQCEGGKLIREDRKELERNIDLEEERIQKLHGNARIEAIKELRRLRRLRK